MARPLRLELPGALHHVTSRGDRREDIYLNDADRQRWLDLLGEVCVRHNWLCHVYCLMDNHFQIVIGTVDGNLSAGMRQLNGVYTQRMTGWGMCFRAASKLSSCRERRIYLNWRAMWC